MAESPTGPAHTTSPTSSASARPTRRQARVVLELRRDLGRPRRARGLRARAGAGRRAARGLDRGLRDPADRPLGLRRHGRPVGASTLWSASPTTASPTRPAGTTPRRWARGSRRCAAGPERMATAGWTTRSRTGAPTKAISACGPSARTAAPTTWPTCTWRAGASRPRSASPTGCRTCTCVSRSSTMTPPPTASTSTTSRPTATTPRCPRAGTGWYGHLVRLAAGGRGRRAAPVAASGRVDRRDQVRDPRRRARAAAPRGQGRRQSHPRRPRGARPAGRATPTPTPTPTPPPTDPDGGKPGPPPIAIARPQPRRPASSGPDPLSSSRGRALIRRVTLRVPAHARLSATCAGKGCPFGRRAYPARKRARVLEIRALRRARLRPGARLTFVLRPRHGKAMVVRYVGNAPAGCCASAPRRTRSRGSGS